MRQLQQILSSALLMLVTLFYTSGPSSPVLWQCTTVDSICMCSRTVWLARSIPSLRMAIALADGDRFSGKWECMTCKRKNLSSKCSFLLGRTITTGLQFPAYGAQASTWSCQIALRLSHDYHLRLQLRLVSSGVYLPIDKAYP
jgi:hypothetical protein